MHGEGEYAFPRRTPEYLESFAECARRETAEECGIEVSNIQFQFLANVTSYAPKHYVHIGVTADWKSGDPEVLEPDKSESWEWYSLDELPEPMFAMYTMAVEAHRERWYYKDA